MRKTESIIIHENKMFTIIQKTSYLKGKITNRSIQVKHNANHGPISINTQTDHFDKHNINKLQKTIHEFEEDIIMANARLNRYEDLLNSLKTFSNNYADELEKLNIEPLKKRMALTEAAKTDMTGNFANRHDVVLTTAREYLEKANWGFATAGNYLLTDRHKKIHK